MNLSNLPQDFPVHISTSFQEGEFKGKKQLWANYEHGGKRYKLVVTGARPDPGVVWLVYPDNSPNGHIVFVTLYPPKTEEELWSNHDDFGFDYDDWRQRQEELFYERSDEY